MICGFPALIHMLMVMILSDKVIISHFETKNDITLQIFCNKVSVPTI